MTASFHESVDATMDRVPWNVECIASKLFRVFGIVAVPRLWFQ